MTAKQTRSTMDVVHPSRQSQLPGSTRPSKKPRRMESPIYKKQTHASSVNAIKKRIRDVKRRLERSQNLPATIRAEDERALAAYKQELVAADEEKARQRMIKKYHMVRFFERQKATRQLKKLRKKLLEAQSSEVTAIKAKMHVAEVDLNYTQYYPLCERYIGLYPQKDSDGDETGNQIEDKTRKPPIWAEVEKRMVNGTLDQLRNGSSAAGVRQGKIRSSEPIPVQSKDVSMQAKLNGISTKHSPGLTNPRVRNLEHHNLDRGKRKMAKKVTESIDEDKGSDGGFFEE